MQTGHREWQRYFSSLESRPTAVSDWISLSQLEVDLYGGLIGDLDPMHNDPDWAPGIEKWGGPIVIGSHLVSMLPAFLRLHGFPVNMPDVQFDVRGLTRARFIAPLRIDQRVRDQLQVVEVAEVAPHTWRVKTQHTLERGSLEDCDEVLDKPFMFAELITEYCEVA
jgi:acyl dehydratase